MALMTNAALSTFKIKAEEIFSKGQYKDQYLVRAKTAQIIKSMQSASIKDLKITDKQEKDNQVEITWIDACAITDEAAPADWCDVSANPLATKKEAKALNLTRASGFSIDDNDVAGSIYTKEEAIALGELKAKAVLDEWLSAQGLLFLNANSGVNKYPTPYVYDAASKSTQIPEAKYNRKIVAHWEKLAEMHDIDLPYYIDSGLLWEDVRNAEFDAGNGEGKGDKARVDALGLNFDIKGFIKAGITPDDTFMVGKHAVALGARYYNPDVPTTFAMRDGTQTRYNVLSNNIPGVRYDVIYQLACEGKRFIHTWKYILNAGYFLNPTGCEADVTGIMSFSQVP